MEAPWRLHQNYLLDYRILKFGKLEDGVLTFSTQAAAEKVQADQAELVGAA